MLRSKIERFVERFLKPYPQLASKSKFLHDPLWGTIEVKDYELGVLDTPLVQRLRQIHQTGLLYATYPTARHTRFEHTIGAMHLAGRMAEKLRRRYPRIATVKTEQKVRLACLLHDTGHAAFSHSSEEVFSHARDIALLIKDGGE